MNKKVLIFPLLFLLLLIFSGCSTRNSQEPINNIKNINNTGINPKADKVEVFLFHTNNRCATCIAIGKLSETTIYEYFQPEIRDGKIEFREVNIDLPENKELSDKFQAVGSALFINAIYEGSDHISEDVAVWRLTSNETQFKNYLKNILDNLLGK